MAVRGELELRGVPDRPNPYSLYPWLLIASGSVSDTVHGRMHPVWLAGWGLAAFAILYMATIWVRWRTFRQHIAYLLLAMLGGLTLAMNIVFRADAIVLFPMLSIAVGAVVSWRERQEPPLPLVAVFATACTAALVTWLQGYSGGDVWQAWYSSMLPGLIVVIIFRFIVAIAELRRAREELARSAVDAERLRFARDVHDLLGHTLSVMVVKAQLVRKLAARDPELAAQQAADIEETGRQALTEVRKAVTGYRGRGLTREIDAARAALADAGIAAIIRQDGPPVADETDAVLGWVVREGVTNVIKHSGCQRCEISVRHERGTASVEITDNGHGSVTAPLPPGGHGLGGLTERVAAAGGTLEAGPRPCGGFRLAAAITSLAREEPCQ
jgi:two-component system sensor histidine kinase DesK